MSRSLTGNSLEDFVELWLGDFPVIICINGLDQSLNFFLGGLSIGSHMLEGSIDEVEDFVSVEGVASIGVELRENCIDGLPELLIVV